MPLKIQRVRLNPVNISNRRFNRALKDWRNLLSVKALAISAKPVKNSRSLDGRDLYSGMQPHQVQSASYSLFPIPFSATGMYSTKMHRATHRLSWKGAVSSSQIQDCPLGRMTIEKSV